MKFGALRVYYLELTWQILGAIPAEARAGERAEFFCQVNNARLYRFPVSQISPNLREHRQRLPTSGRDFSEKNTNRGKSRQVRTPAECWLSICTVGINLKSFSWPAG